MALKSLIAGQFYIPGTGGGGAPSGPAGGSLAGTYPNPTLAGQVDVALAATGGAGTSGSPWTGWDTAITWAANTTYHFRDGYFSYVDSPNFALDGIHLIGSAGTVLKHTGTGVAFNMDAGAGSVWLSEPAQVENITILGNVNTTDAFFLRGIRNGLFANLAVWGCTGAGLRSQACVTNILENFICSHHACPGDAFVFTPTNGIILEERGTADEASTTWSIINPVVEGVSQEGIWFKTGGGGRKGSYGNTIINGTSEGNTHVSKASVRISGRYNLILNLDSEANTSGLDFLIEGSNNEMRGCTSTGLVSVSGGTCILGPGQYQDVTNTGYLNLFQCINVAGTFTDNGTSTRYVNTDGADLRSTMGAMMPEPVSVSISGGNLATNAASGNFFIANGTANYTLTNPTNAGTGAKAYQSVTWKIVQDAGRTVAFGSEWRFLTRNISSSDLITFLASYTGTWYFTAVRNSTDSKWDIIDVQIDGLQNKLLGNTTITGRVTTGAGDDSNMALAMNEAATGFYRIGSGNMGVCGSLFRLHTNGINFGGGLAINWYTGGAFAAVSSSLARKADSVLGLYDEGANTAQTFRIYGDATKYLSLSHNGTYSIINDANGSGLMLGSSNADLVSIWGAAPNAQPTTGISAASFVANTSLIADDSATWGGYTMGQVVAALKQIGALA